MLTAVSSGYTTKAYGKGAGAEQSGYLMKFENFIFKLKKLRDFLTIEIWRIREQELPLLYSYILRLLKIFVITIRKF
ncbi:MAG: hypothetical protein DRG27_02720, partial [Deltaproteobacteria bacterium]